MSWNPSPTIGTASWNGSPSLITKNQLFSTVVGIEQAIVNYSTITVSTLTVPDWISTSALYVSDIKGARIDVSGIVFDASGLLYAPTVSSQSGVFNNITNVSVQQFVFKPTFTGNIQVSFDLGLGQAIGGFLAGLGAAVGGALIGVGTGLGLAIQGAEQGIATMIAGRPQNNITNNTYETINFTSQLQVSTLGNAQIAYSSIFRTVSSSSANQVPGREIFTSTIFYPGQICIRAASDPINLITGDPNLNTSTIQSFGQWVPLTGLEPDAITGNSVSTNFLSTGQASMGSNTVFFENITGGQSNNYNAPLIFNTGSGNNAKLVGYLQNLYMQTNNGFVFTQYNSATEAGSLYLGTGANQSLLNVSSIFSRGSIQANTGYFSSLTVNDLTVISTFSTQYTIVECNVLSTSIVTAYLVSTQNLQAQYTSPFTFSSILGNPTGPFDITRYDSLFSTTYNSVSSLQQNILNYSLNLQVQDEATFNIGDPGPLGVTFNVTPANIQQWASTQIIFNGYQGPGGIDLGWVGQWGVTPGDTTGVAPGGATFDVLYAPNPGTGFNAPFYLTEESNRSYPVGTSTFYQQPNPNPPGPITFSARMTLPPVIGGSRSGWWQMTTPAPPPYASSNNNTFQIYQDINDTYIQGTDRLHLVAGDVFVDGSLVLSNANLNVNSVTAPTINSSNGFFINFLSTGSVRASTVYATSFLSSATYLNPLTFTGDFNASPVQNPLNFTYNLNTVNYQIQRTLTVPSRGPNMFNSMNVNEWNNTIWYAPTGTNATTGGPQIYLGELTRTSGFAYGPAKFWINNTVLPAVNFPVSVVRSGGWLSSIGNAVVSGTGFNLIQTPDGVNWTLTSNVANPVGLGGQSYSNSYNLQLNQQLTQLNVGMPYTEVVSGTKTTTANKIMLNANQIRTITYGSPSFPPREAGFELSSYFDANVVFEGSSTQSDAVNNIISPAGSLGYACVAWSPQLWFGRMRTDYGIQGFEIEAVVSAISGTFGDLIWASHRYINITLSPAEANIREIYFMVPANWMTYENLLGPY